MTTIRNDWSREEIAQIYNTPILDLMYRAATVHREFHDAVLKENSIPIEMIRASLTDMPLRRDDSASWRFYDLPANEDE